MPSAPAALSPSDAAKIERDNFSDLPLLFAFVSPFGTLYSSTFVSAMQSRNRNCRREMGLEAEMESARGGKGRKIPQQPWEGRGSSGIASAWPLFTYEDSV